ncbi:interferon epsilon-like [Gopherus evgoodei]|uniref:interferon epsilon-like n=1 Tax=Gopherus evgoodei TaxID=1825980 RepID=UPI0011CFD6C1|nr:interferon epsilon-like [Gopherus evgoodei]
MTTRCLLNVCLVLLFSTEISSRLCTMLHFQKNTVNKESLELLKKMSRNFPSQCINKRAAFKLTQNVTELSVTQKENAKVAIQEILQEIFNIFSKNLTQSAWDGISIVRFFTSKIGLYQQIQRLEACLRTQMEKELTNPESEDLQHTSQRVKKYFQGIDAFLKENQYSLCAWEIIRAEIHRCFVLIDKLTRRLSN